jgi:hypothetical protein
VRSLGVNGVEYDEIRRSLALPKEPESTNNIFDRCHQVASVIHAAGNSKRRHFMTFSTH